MRQDRVDSLSFKLQELSSDAASCNISIFSIPNFMFIRNCVLTVCWITLRKVQG